MRVIVHVPNLSLLSIYSRLLPVCMKSSGRVISVGGKCTDRDLLTPYVFLTSLSPDRADDQNYVELFVIKISRLIQQINRSIVCQYLPVNSRFISCHYIDTTVNRYR